MKQRLRKRTCGIKRKLDQDTTLGQPDQKRVKLQHASPIKTLNCCYKPKIESKPPKQENDPCWELAKLISNHKFESTTANPCDVNSGDYLLRNLNSNLVSEESLAKNSILVQGFI